jgi:hypothetical protein
MWVTLILIFPLLPVPGGEEGMDDGEGSVLNFWSGELVDDGVEEDEELEEENG